MFGAIDAQSPFDRLPTYGFRCVKILPGTAVPEATLAPIPLISRDFAKERPVPDSVFAIYKNLYRYDARPLDAAPDPIEESNEFWTKQKVTFKAAYGNERMSAYLFLPKKGSPPYQTVVFFPSTDPFAQGPAGILISSDATSSSRAAERSFTQSIRALTNAGTSLCPGRRPPPTATTLLNGLRTWEERSTTSRHARTSTTRSSLITA